MLLRAGKANVLMWESLEMSVFCWEGLMELVMEMYTVTGEQSMRPSCVGYGMARLGLFGGGGGMSSESGSGGCFRFWAWTAWAQRSTYSRRISFVTGSRMLLHTAGERGNKFTHIHTHTHRRKEGSYYRDGDRFKWNTEFVYFNTGKKKNTPYK